MIGLDIFGFLIRIIPEGIWKMKDAINSRSLVIQNVIIATVFGIILGIFHG